MKILIYHSKYNSFCYQIGDFSINDMVCHTKDTPIQFSYLTFIETQDQEELNNLYAIKVNDIIGYIFDYNLSVSDIKFLQANNKEVTKIHVCNGFFKIKSLSEPHFNNFLRLSDIKNDITHEEEFNDINT